ncbi:MAG TPA: hypothetical protein VEQ63_15890 [Bryobacteraceae bacterium]|nr:hypothetical protein [Bryobacteraceae bacterium]
MELEARIREVLQDEMPGDPDKIERAVHRLLELVNPFEKAAQEELDRYRVTFAELAK